MAKTTWGRKESIIWPYYRPLYTYATITLCVVLTGLFVCYRFAFSHESLQRFYAPLYVRTTLIGSLRAQHRSTYRILFVAGGRMSPRPAMNVDVVSGRTPELGGSILPLTLSESIRQQGYTLLFRGPVRSYVDSRLSVYLKDVVYGGRAVVDLSKPSLLAGAFSLMALLPFAVTKDVKRQKQLKYGRRLKGP
jgi:hypothetical protein